ncbi:tripartite tricarboxylate transporter permease [Salipiger sp.]|uniref:tripartite tricarboxylate transporter permease n=1 Tax=Salipiger sp. TaxID=2078585 RepID=UPI003A981C70
MDPILDALALSFAQLASLSHLGMILLGVAIGIVVGMLPGLGGTAGLSLLLPFAYGMDPSQALALMIGLLAPMHTADTIPAVLMGIPGTASAQATVMDGFPMAKRGEAARALAAAFMASMFGGLIGAAVLTFAVFFAKPIILAMGFGELMMLTIFALSTVGVVTGQSALKGLAVCALGLLLGCIGPADATGEYRVTFDSLYLSEGLPLVVVALGLFAVPEVVDLLRRGDTISETGRITTGWGEGVRDVIRNKWLVLRSALLGVGLGALPGLGGSVADWIVYGQAVHTARDKSNFGKGDVRGVIAPEAANNAVTGGALIPTLLFGIPGSGSMAILLGGLILIGIQPGPAMVTTNLDLSFVIIWSLALANLAGAAACFALSRPVARLTTLHYGLIGPVMIAILFFAAFQATRSWYDLVGLFAIGTLGVFMKRFGWSRPAMLIGFVLSNGLEASFYRVAQLYGTSFLSRPIVIGILVLTCLSVIAAIRLKRSDIRKDEPAYPLRARLPQIGFVLCLMALALLVFVDSLGQSELARIFPFWTGLIALALLVATLAFQVLPPTRNTVMADEEIGQTSGRSNAYFAMWILGFLLSTAIFGMPAGAAVFVFLFTTVIVGRPVWRNLALAAGTAAVMLALGAAMNLYYPDPWISKLIAQFA